MNMAARYRPPAFRATPAELLVARSERGGRGGRRRGAGRGGRGFRHGTDAVAVEDRQAELLFLLGDLLAQPRSRLLGLGECVGARRPARETRAIVDDAERLVPESVVELLEMLAEVRLERMRGYL